MARKIKFPLEMKNGVMVRTLEELNENFDFEKLILHYKTGKLLIWLEDRYYDYEAEQLKELNIEEHDFNQKLCDIFKVEYSKEFEVDIEELERRNKRLSQLKQFTNDEEVLRNIDNVAFNQEELADLLDNEVNSIYLCGDKFNIPLRIENITYIGVNNPIVNINSNNIVNFEEKKIEFKNIKFNKEYENLLNNLNEKDTENKTCSKVYKTSYLLDFMMNNYEREISKNLFNTIVKEFNDFKYDIDSTSKSKVKIINDENLNKIFKIINDANLNKVFKEYIEKIY